MHYRSRPRRVAVGWVASGCLNYYHDSHKRTQDGLAWDSDDHCTIETKDGLFCKWIAAIDSWSSHRQQVVGRQCMLFRLIVRSTNHVPRDRCVRGCGYSTITANTDRAYVQRPLGSHAIFFYLFDVVLRSKCSLLLLVLGKASFRSVCRVLFFPLKNNWD
jgi:hypothetical protein